MKVEKTKTKPGGSERRKSTGNAADIIFSKAKPIPNYLRASSGSCHDFCKYGGKRDLPPELEQDRVKARPLSSRRHTRPNELKPKPLVINATKKTSSPLKIPSSNTGINKSKIESEIGVREANTNAGHQNADGMVSSCLTSNQKQKSWEKAVRIGSVVMKENGSSPRKQKMKMEKALRIESGEVVDGWHSIHNKDESIVAKMSKDKVKTLVDSFENLVNIQHSKSLRPYRGLAHQNM